MPLPSKPMGILKVYHKEAMAALAGDDQKVQPRKRLQRLDKMTGPIRRLPMFREVFVANAVIGKVRAASANKQMNNLRKSYSDSGKIEKYEAFDALVSSYLGPRSFTSHGFLDRSLSGVEDGDVYEGIHRLISVINEFGYNCFVNSGTLLGLVRNKGLIPYDDDIDLAVMLDAKNDADAAEEFKILLGMFLDHGLDCYFVEGLQAIMKLPDIEGFEVDLFPAYGAPDEMNIYPYARESLMQADILPLSKCAVSGLPLPARPEVLLKQNYGEGWPEPDPRFVFPWGPQKDAFRPLLEEMVIDA